MTVCSFITGPRGSGKGAFSVHLAKTEYLDEGKRVASNIDLYLDELYPPDSDISVTRIPDKPNADHMYSLGQAYGFDSKDPSTIDPSKNGALFIDEISLFLESKKDPEFKALMAFFMLSRKLGWDLYFVCQEKGQIDDTFYKALCNRLIICQSDSLLPIPILGSVLEKVGLSGMLPDKHTATVFGGRSELNTVIKTIPYNWRPYKTAYNTYQLFTDGVELVGEQLLDMRANFTYLPHSYISGEKFFTQAENRFNELQKIYRGDDAMAFQKQSNIGLYVKMGLLVVILAGFLYFNNPMENEFISGEASTPVSQVSQSSTTSLISTVSSSSTTSSNDFISNLFANYRPRLSAFMSSPELGVTGYIDFYDDDELSERLTVKELHRFGYSASHNGAAVVISGHGQEFYVTRWPLPKLTQNPVDLLLPTSGVI